MSAPKPKERQSSPWTTAALIGAALVLLFGGFLAINLVLEEDNALSGWFTDFIGTQMPIEELDEEGRPKKPMTEKEKAEYIKWRKANRDGKNAVKPGSEQPAEKTD